MRFFLLIITTALIGMLSCSEKQEGDTSVEIPAKSSSSSPYAEEVLVDIDLNEYLQGKVKVLDAEGEFRLVEHLSPKKYYAFYETGSFCQPCHEFSPALNTFYEVYQELYGDQFALIVISYDITDELTKEYAQKKMKNLPHLNYEDKKTLKNELPFLKEVYPNLIITDARGKVLKSSFDKYRRFHGPEVAMNYLKSKLEEK